MYRIMQARNGYYYVQKLFRTGWVGWSRVSSFFRTKRQCRDYIDSQRNCCGPRVVEYY